MPPLSSRPEVRRGVLRVRLPRRLAQPGEEQRADDERRRVDRDRGARAHDHDQRARGRRADDVAGVLGEADERVGLLELVRRHERGGEAAGRRAEEGLERAVGGAEDQQVPELGAAREEQRGEDGLDGGAAEIAEEHQPAAGHAVGPDAGDEDEERHRHHLRGEHQAELRGAAVEAVEHGERERDREQGVADHGDGLAREEQAEVAMAEDGDGAHGGETVAGALDSLRLYRYSLYRYR